jgi:hypothetical protein
MPARLSDADIERILREKHDEWDAYAPRDGEDLWLLDLRDARALLREALPFVVAYPEPSLAARIRAFLGDGT